MAATIPTMLVLPFIGTCIETMHANMAATIPTMLVLPFIGTCIKTVHNVLCRQDKERVLCEVRWTSESAC